jgi:hypothetical protein
MHTSSFPIRPELKTPRKSKCVNKLTPWKRFFAEKLTYFQLLKKFPALYGIAMSITAFTKARPVSRLL